jgi:hypothetical protein
MTNNKYSSFVYLSALFVFLTLSFVTPAVSYGQSSTTGIGAFPNLPPPLSNPSSISITSDNKNTYTLSSGFSKITSFVTTYTITGGLDSIRSSSDLIISTITKDFDSNANIGYVRSGSSSSQPSPQQQKNQIEQQQQQNMLPNPFVDKSMVNETISTALQDAISSSTISVGGYTQIKCNFGMNLADYICNNNVPFLAK